MTPDDRPRAEIRHPWRLVLLCLAAWAALFAFAVWQSDDAGADVSGVVATCQTLQLWDANGLGVVTVTHVDGTVASEGPLGNAVTYPNDGPHGRIVAVVTAHHAYTVPAPAGCTTTTTSSSTTTSVPASTTTTLPDVPPTPGTMPVPSSTVPGSTVPPPSAPGTTLPPAAVTTLPPAPPAVPVVATPRVTG